MKCSTRSAGNRYQIGTSGYMVGKAKWLKQPCLNCIEYNSSFYRIPGDSAIKALNQLPPNVNVIIKASRYITHMKRLHDVREAWETLWKQIKKLKGKLVCVLFQLPPSFSWKLENQQRIEAMHSYLPPNIAIAFEFRNKTWLRPAVYDVFARLRWAIVGTYIKKREHTKWVGDMPPGLFLPPVTSAFNYVRIHGKKGWKGSLSHAELNNLRDKVGKQKVKRSFVMFNNSFFDNRSTTCTSNDVVIKSAAVCNAIQFTHLLRHRRTRRLRRRSKSKKK